MDLQRLLERIEHRKKWRKEYRMKKIGENRKYWDDYKLVRGCSVCGYNKCGRALEFHHLNEDKKERSISRMIGQQVNKEEIEKEVEKCIVICANCHRELHAEEKKLK